MRDRSISLCMIVRNEERQISSCLESIRELVDEMIVVDTGSSDSTVHIAAGFGAQVSRFEFTTVDFAAARNFGLEQARGDWILVLDADERLEPSTVPLIRQCLDFSDTAGYFFERRNFNERSQRFTTDHVVRLFPNRKEHRFRGRVHETVHESIVKAGGRLQSTGIILKHFFSRDDDERRRKNEWYVSLLLQELAENPQDDRPLDFLAAEYHQLGRIDLAAETAERIAAVRPMDPQAHLIAGIYRLLHKADAAGARDAFDRALKLRPGYLEALSFLRSLERGLSNRGVLPPGIPSFRAAEAIQ